MSAEAKAPAAEGCCSPLRRRRLSLAVMRRLAEISDLPTGTTRARALWRALLTEQLEAGLCEVAAGRLTDLLSVAASALAQALDERDAVREELLTLRVRCNRGCH